MAGRKYTASSSKYRYGFNGKENDNDVKGEGNQQDYGMRIYDSRLVKFLSVDPLKKDYPWYTPYQFAGNSPIRFIDLDGLEPANNPNVPGANEARAIAEVSTIKIASDISNTLQNLFSRGYSEKQKLRGKISCNTRSEYVTDTKGDPLNKYNMKISTAVTLNVDESQAQDFNNYESFVVNQLMKNLVSGSDVDNYDFPINGIISNKFLNSDILNEALSKYKTGEIKDGMPYQAEFKGKQLRNDIAKNESIFSSITGFVGSAQITIKKVDSKTLEINIFNITSLTSGDLWKEIYPSESKFPKSYVRYPEIRTPYANISQTFHLLIPIK